LRNGAELSLPFSIASALFLSQRGCYSSNAKDNFSFDRMLRYR
jgi:hypothetical protein